MRSPLIACLVCLLLCGGLPQGYAQDAVVDRYELLIRKGSAAFDEGDYSGAQAAFEGAYALSPNPRLLYNIAVSIRRQKQDQEAIGAFEAFLASPAAEPELRALAREALQELRAERKAKEQAVIESPVAKADEGAPIASYAGITALALGTGAFVWGASRLYRARRISRELGMLEMGTPWNDEESRRYIQGEEASRQGIVFSSTGLLALAAGGLLLYLGKDSGSSSSKTVALFATEHEGALLGLSGAF